MDRLVCAEGLVYEVGMREARVIAVVDDDESFRDALQRLLRTLGYQVQAFASGEEFVRSSHLGLVACVILDLALPGMSGLEVQHQLAARGLQIAIAVVTALTEATGWDSAQLRRGRLPSFENQ